MSLLCERLKQAMEATIPPTRAIDLAKAAHVSKATVSEWLNCKTQDMKASMLVKVAAHLNVSSYWLATGAGAMIASQIGDAPANYGHVTPNKESTRKAAEFLFEEFDISELKQRGAEWTAATIIMLADLMADPGHAQLNRQTILKLIQKN